MSLAFCLCLFKLIVTTTTTTSAAATATTTAAAATATATATATPTTTTTYYLLPTTYYLLPTTYYLLPTTYYLPPTTTTSANVTSQFLSCLGSYELIASYMDTGLMLISSSPQSLVSSFMVLWSHNTLFRGGGPHDWYLISSWHC